MILLIVLIVIIVLYLIACVLFYFLQEFLLFKRKQFRKDFPYHYDFPFEELFWDTPDGNTLNGLWIKVPNPKGVILFLHGNSGHMARSGNYFKRVKDLNYDVVLYDYRGYGKSTGVPAKETFYSDAILIFDWVKKQYPQSKIIVHGLSLGSHIATYLGAHRKFDLLIMETPFLSIAHIAKFRFPMLPGTFLLKYNLDSSEFLPHITCPIHVFCGDKDTVVPLSEPLLIPNYNPNVCVTIIKDANHKNVHEFDEYHQKFEEILHLR